jgi:hypothetical protein
VLLPDDLLKALRAVFSGKDAVAHGAGNLKAPGKKRKGIRKTSVGHGVSGKSSVLVGVSLRNFP